MTSGLCNFLRRMARPERVELPTFWFVAVAAQEIKHLQGVLRSGTNCARVCTNRGFRAFSRHVVTLSKVWWWA